MGEARRGGWQNICCCGSPHPALRATLPTRGREKKARTVECRASYRKTGSHFFGTTLSGRQADATPSGQLDSGTPQVETGHEAEHVDLDALHPGEADTCQSPE